MKYKIKDIIILVIVIICIFIVYKYNKSYKNFNNIDEYILPKRIYSYYDNPDDIIKAHYETWKRKLPDWEIILIDNTNLYNIVDRQFIDKYVKLDSIKFSDFLRVYLLKENGGVWLDGGIFIKNGEFLNQYYDEMMNNKYDACLYEYTIKTVKHNDIIIPHLDNWFMMSKKNSKYMNDLFNEFTKAYEMGFLEYKKNVLIQNNINLINTIGKSENDIYLMQHAIAQYLIYKNGLDYYNINKKVAEDSMFYIQQLNKWNSPNIISDIINRSDWYGLYAIKLIGPNRKAITNDIKDKYISKINSL
jgi:hypothetical protein